MFKFFSSASSSIESLADRATKPATAGQQPGSSKDAADKKPSCIAAQQKQASPICITKWANRSEPIKIILPSGSPTGTSNWPNPSEPFKKLPPSEHFSSSSLALPFTWEDDQSPSHSSLAPPLTWEDGQSPSHSSLVLTRFPKRRTTKARRNNTSTEEEMKILKYSLLGLTVTLVIPEGDPDDPMASRRRNELRAPKIRARDGGSVPALDLNERLDEEMWLTKPAESALVRSDSVIEDGGWSRGNVQRVSRGRRMERPGYASPRDLLWG